MIDLNFLDIPVIGIIDSNFFNNSFIFQTNIESSPLMPTPVPSNIDDCEAVVNGFGLARCESDIGHGAERGAGIVTEQLQLSKGDRNVIPLSQRMISALISEERGSENEDYKFDVCDKEFEADEELELSSLDPYLRANDQFACHSAYNGYRITGKRKHVDTENDISSPDLNSSQPTLTCSGLEYNTLDLNEKLLLELKSIGIAPEPDVCYFSKNFSAIFHEISSFLNHVKYQI